MNIKTVIEHLNKQKGYAINTEYYTQVELWDNWWRGMHAPFYQFIEHTETGAKRRKLYTLGMAKKVAEDWASILLNEKTQIVIDDKASSEFVQGAEAEQGSGGIFGANDFWSQGNALVEKAFYSGTGAFVVKLHNMAMGDTGDVLHDPETSVHIDYLPAMSIIPLTVEVGKITEVAFASEILQKGVALTYIESHMLENGQYVIYNELYKTNNEQMTSVDLPPGMAAVFHTGSDIPLFSIFSPNIVNNIRGNNGLGISIYANAIDNLQGVDLTFNNFCRDFKLGGKKVFYSDELTRQDAKGNTITPDDMMQQLFANVGESVVDENGNNRLMQEYNPALRVEENKEGVQSQLDYLSFKCGLGTKHYQFNSGSVLTATQYTGDKQELIQNASKHYIVIEQALQRLVRAILWAGKEILGLPVNPDAKVTVNFEDSYIIDKESERLRDLQEIRDGLMQKWEYRTKWRGEDEQTAKAMTQGGMSDDDLMGFANAQA